jgi:serine-type D-Ala-D-Ala carboxypeptidase/endopeptidase
LSSSPPEVEPLVSELLLRHTRRHVSVVVGVLRGGRSWVMGAGTAGQSPPAANTIFETGSVTKVFTATLLAGMVDEGLLTLDDPVQRYLPPGVELPVRGRPITLGDLATHTAGLRACRTASRCARCATGPTRTPDST